MSAAAGRRGSRCGEESGWWLSSQRVPSKSAMKRNEIYRENRRHGAENKVVSKSLCSKKKSVVVQATKSTRCSSHLLPLPRFPRVKAITLARSFQTFRRRCPGRTIIPIAVFVVVVVFVVIIYRRIMMIRKTTCRRCSLLLI